MRSTQLRLPTIAAFAAYLLIGVPALFCHERPASAMANVF